MMTYIEDLLRVQKHEIHALRNRVEELETLIEGLKIENDKNINYERN